MQAARTLIRLHRSLLPAGATLIEGLNSESGLSRIASMLAIRATRMVDAKLVTDLVHSAFDADSAVSDTAISSLDELIPQSETECGGMIRMLTFPRCAAFLYKPLLAFFRQKV